MSGGNHHSYYEKLIVNMGLMMNVKYKIDNQFIFVPKNNMLLPIHRSGEKVILGTNESRLLSYLIENRQRTISRKELMSALWGMRDIYVEDSSLTQSVSILRKALNDSIKFPNFIKTVPKLGYEFVAPIEDLFKPDMKTKASIDHEVTQFDYKQFQQGRGNLEPLYFQMHSSLLRFEVYIVSVNLVFLGFYFSYVF